jgi:hypothetical protein
MLSRSPAESNSTYVVDSLDAYLEKYLEKYFETMALRGRVEQLKPKHPWVGLTDEEVNTIYEQAEVLVNNSWVGDGTVGLMFPITLYKMFEAKLKGKNT